MGVMYLPTFHSFFLSVYSVDTPNVSLLIAWQKWEPFFYFSPKHTPTVLAPYTIYSSTQLLSARKTSQLCTAVLFFLPSKIPFYNPKTRRERHPANHSSILIDPTNIFDTSLPASKNLLRENETEICFFKPCFFLWQWAKKESWPPPGYSSRQNCIALFVHSTFTIRSQNTIYSGYNRLSHQWQN